MLNILPTTEQAVLIQRIVEEDPDIRSVICLNGTTEEVSISRPYHSFVKRPTGVVEKCFGESAYRVDLSGRVDSGNSWQLPLFLAHYVKSRGDEHFLGIGAIWSTGQINNNLEVSAVEHITEKVLLSERFIRETLENRQQVVMLVSPENLPSLEAALEELALNNHPLIRLEAVRDVSPAALDQLFVLSPGESDTRVPTKNSEILSASSRIVTRNFRLSPKLILLASISLFALAVVAWGGNSLSELKTSWEQGDWQRLSEDLDASPLPIQRLFEQWTDQYQLAHSELQLSRLALVSGGKRSCFSVSRSGLAEQRQVVWLSGTTGDSVAVQEGGSICAVRYLLENTGDRELFVSLTLGEVNVAEAGPIKLTKLEANSTLEYTSYSGGGVIEPNLTHRWMLAVSPVSSVAVDRDNIADPRLGGLWIEGSYVPNSGMGIAEFKGFEGSASEVDGIETSDQKRFK